MRLATIFTTIILALALLGGCDSNNKNNDKEDIFNGKAPDQLDLETFKQAYNEAIETAYLGALSDAPISAFAAQQTIDSIFNQLIMPTMDTSWYLRSLGAPICYGTQVTEADDGSLTYNSQGCTEKQISLIDESFEIDEYYSCNNGQNVTAQILGLDTSSDYPVFNHYYDSNYETEVSGVIGEEFVIHLDEYETPFPADIEGSGYLHLKGTITDLNVHLEVYFHNCKRETRVFHGKTYVKGQINQRPPNESHYVFDANRSNTGSYVGGFQFFKEFSVKTQENIEYLVSGYAKSTSSINLTGTVDPQKANILVENLSSGIQIRYNNLNNDTILSHSDLGSIQIEDNGPGFVGKFPHHHKDFILIGNANSSALIKIMVHSGHVEAYLDQDGDGTHEEGQFYLSLQEFTNSDLNQKPFVPTESLNHSPFFDSLLLNLASPLPRIYRNNDMDYEISLNNLAIYDHDTPEEELFIEAQWYLDGVLISDWIRTPLPKEMVTSEGSIYAKIAINDGKTRVTYPDPIYPDF